MKEKVLVIDDDPGLLALMRLGLEREGFSVITADSGEEGLRQAYASHPDVVILDIMMPGMDGWLTCQRLRHICDIPIIMLTAKTEKHDLIKGLSLGADDYLTKPCSFEELKARIRTLLRRVRSNAHDEWRTHYDDGNIRIDLANGTVERQGHTVHLTPTESRLLMCLVSNKGQVVSHKELLTSAWGPEYTEEEGYLSVYIRYLRQKLEDDPSNPHYIRTRWGIGYYFMGDGMLNTDEAERSSERAEI